MATCMVDQIIAGLPAEVVEMVLERVPAEQLIELARLSGTARRACEAARVWQTKVLRIPSAAALATILGDPQLVRIARRIDLAGGLLDDAALSEVISAFDRIEAIRIAGVSFDLTDDHIEELLRMHGSHLVHLDLAGSYHLTNRTVELVARLCPRLRFLNLSGCMFSDQAVCMLAESAVAEGLLHLNLSRCHLIRLGKVRQELAAFRRLRHLSLAQNDSVCAVVLEGLLGGLGGLEAIDVSGCVELTRRDIKDIQARRPALQITHTASIDDYSYESIRSFLQAIAGV